MPIGFLSLYGLTETQLAHGLKMSEIPGDRGVVSGFVLIIGIENLTPGEPCGSDILAPANPPVSNSGPADEFGNNSVELGWARLSGDKTWGQVGGGGGSFPDGFWNVLTRGDIFPTDHGDGFIVIEFSTTEVNLFNVNLNDIPSNPTHDDPSWDGAKGTVIVAFDYPNTSMENPDSIAIVRNDQVVANVPWTDGITHYEFPDTVFASGDYTYKFFAYKYADSRSPDSSSIDVSFGGVPSITMTMSGGITFGGSATIAFLGNPTGTYTIVKDKTNDTLYNTDENVAIPNPFIVTGFLPS